MKKNSVAKNYIYNLTYQILVLILPLITTPYISRVLGAEGTGIYSYTISITTYFILFGTLGISMYAQREIAYVQDKVKERSKIFWEIIVVRFITLSLSMILFYLTYARNGEYSMYYRILLLEILANCFDISPFFQGMEEFKKIIVRNLIVKMVSIISVFLFIKTENDTNIYLLIYALSTFLGNISLWFYLPKYVHKVPFKQLQLLKHIRPTIVLFIPQVATQIYTVLDKTMIGNMVVDKAEVGYYEQSQKIVKMLLTIVTSLGTVMLPRIANKFANGKKEEIKENIYQSFEFVYFLAIPLTCGVISVAPIFIPLFLGQAFEKSSILTSIISPIILIIGLSNVIGTQYLLPTKKQKQFTISVVAGAFCNLILNGMLIPKLLSIGAAIATLLAESVVTLVQFYMIRNEFSIIKIVKKSKDYLLAGIGMLILNFLCQKLLLTNVKPVIQLFILVGLGGITYITILIIILKNKYMIECLTKLKEKIKTRKVC